jgi:hypothetical protein
MAAKAKITAEIDGDASGLQRTLRRAEGDVKSWGQRVQGQIGQISQALGTLSKVAAGFGLLQLVSTAQQAWEKIKALDERLRGVARLSSEAASAAKEYADAMEKAGKAAETLKDAAMVEADAREKAAADAKRTEAEREAYAAGRRAIAERFWKEGSDQVRERILDELMDKSGGDVWQVRQFLDQGRSWATRGAQAAGLADRGLTDAGWDAYARGYEERRAAREAERREEEAAAARARAAEWRASLAATVRRLGRAWNAASSDAARLASMREWDAEEEEARREREAAAKAAEAEAAAAAKSAEAERKARARAAEQEANVRPGGVAAASGALAMGGAIGGVGNRMELMEKERQAMIRDIRADLAAALAEIRGDSE